MQELVKAILDHSGMTEEELIDAGNHGADAGRPGFTYYTDTCNFYEANKDGIWDLLRERAEDLGAKGPLGLVAMFSCADGIDDANSFENLMAWFALEEAGRWLASQRESEEESAEEPPGGKSNTCRPDGSRCGVWLCPHCYTLPD